MRGWGQDPSTKWSERESLQPKQPTTAMAVALAREREYEDSKRLQKGTTTRLSLDVVDLTMTDDDVQGALAAESADDLDSFLAN